MILAGDIGGTNTRLAGYKSQDNKLVPVVTETFASSEHRNLESILKKFIDTHAIEVRCACSRYRPFPSEGGHTDFSPRNEVEIELLQYLLKQYDHVSYEHVLSGPGLYNIYKFLRNSGRGSEPVWLKEQFTNNDPSGVISQTALQGKSELCVHALELFVSIYGSEAGNVALNFIATGGLYIGGGIAPKIIDKLKDGRFMKAFVNKGRMRPLLESIPVYVILNDKTALLGAASVAKDFLSKGAE